MLQCICSGGQTGADLGALIAAKQFGIETSGWAPRGWITEKGPKPEYEQLYGLKEHKPVIGLVSDHIAYVLRTGANVRDSQGTIRFASDWKSNGEKCTLKHIKAYGRPYIDVDVKNPIPIEEVTFWITDNNIQILNVAGNRESKSLGIGSFVTNYMSRLLKAMGFEPVT